MDSYSRYAQDVLSKFHFHRVHPDDLDEVMVRFALILVWADNADNFRIYPLNQKDGFMKQAASGCCGSFNSQVKCPSGRIYWVGFNYGH